MIFWIDAQLSPSLAKWLEANLAVEAYPVRLLGLRHAKDTEIFAAARGAGATVITKDKDFVQLVLAQGAPPQVVWLTCGNTPNDRLKRLLEACFAEIVHRLQQGASIVQGVDEFTLLEPSALSDEDNQPL